jgi:molybdopterin-binding protein
MPRSHHSTNGSNHSIRYQTSALSLRSIKDMLISARNSFKGTVTKINTGAVNTEVIIEITPGVEVAAIITKSSADNLQLVEGGQAIAIVKASDVIVAV